MLRRFDRLHCRILLKIQDQLTCLEQRLDSLDVEWAREESRREDGYPRDNSTLRTDGQERKDLLEKNAIQFERIR